jgi:thiamine-monophosphate kinase
MSIKFEGNEFDLIRYIKERTVESGRNLESAVLGIGDDAAIFKGFEGFGAISTDMLVEGVDFDLTWADPYSLGVKSLEVSLSDIAAMGSTPRYSLLSVALPSKVLTNDFLSNFIDGYLFSAERSGVLLIGGDLSRITGPLVIDSTVIGSAEHKGVRRSGAKKGDGIFVSGRLGGASAGLEILMTGEQSSQVESPLLERQLRPTARVSLGRLLGQSPNVSSMIDVSDGLLGDLGHVLDASGLGAQLDLRALPLEDGISELIESGRLTGRLLPDNPVGISLAQWFAMTGGEDFELLFTASSDFEFNRLSELTGQAITKIGVITEESGLIRTDIKGQNAVLPKISHTHF